MCTEELVSRPQPQETGQSRPSLPPSLPGQTRARSERADLISGASLVPRRPATCLLPHHRHNDHEYQIYETSSKHLSLHRHRGHLPGRERTRASRALHIALGKSLIQMNPRKGKEKTQEPQQGALGQSCQGQVSPSPGSGWCPFFKTSRAGGKSSRDTKNSGLLWHITVWKSTETHTMM